MQEPENETSKKSLAEIRRKIYVIMRATKFNTEDFERIKVMLNFAFRVQLYVF